MGGGRSRPMLFAISKRVTIDTPFFDFVRIVHPYDGDSVLIRPNGLDS